MDGISEENEGRRCYMSFIGPPYGWFEKDHQKEAGMSNGRGYEGSCTEKARRVERGWKVAACMPEMHEQLGRTHSQSKTLVSLRKSDSQEERAAWVYFPRRTIRESRVSKCFQSQALLAPQAPSSLRQALLAPLPGPPQTQTQKTLLSGRALLAPRPFQRTCQGLPWQRHQAMLMPGDSVLLGSGPVPILPICAGAPASVLPCGSRGAKPC